jgi:putative transposase
MAQFRFQIGLHVSLGSEEFILHSHSDDNLWVLRNLSNGNDLTCTMENLLHKYENHELVALLDDNGRYPITKHLEEKLHRDLNTFPSYWVEIAEKLLPYLQAIDEHNIPLDSVHLTKMITSVSAGTKDKAPSASKVYRNYRNWVACGRDFRAIIPSYSSRGRKRVTNDTTLARILRESIDNIYKVRQPGSVNDVRLDVLLRVEKENAWSTKNNRITVPSLSTIYREIALIPKFEVAKAQKGERQTRIDYRTTLKGPDTSRPLEICEVDHTPSDLLIVDDNTFLPLGRPTITSIVDKFTRSILSIRTEFSPESSTTVARSLRQAILPKTYLAREYPEVKNKWECYGVPEILRWDNAMHFHSNHLATAGRQLGCDITYGKKDCPWYRAQVERFLGKLNHDLLHKQPGTTFSNILERGDYDPAKNAIVTWRTFDKILHIWTVDIYMQSPNRGMEDIPAFKWRSATSIFPPPLPPSAAELCTALGETEIRTAFHYGIELFSLQYNCERLGELRRQFGMSLDVEVNFDRSDIGQIYVLDPKRKEYFRVPAVSSEYASGLNLWQHNVIRRFARETLHLKTNEFGLAEAKAKIRELVWNDLRNNPNKTHKSSARFLDCHIDNQILPPIRKGEPTSTRTESVTFPSDFEDIPSENLPSYETELKAFRDSRDPPKKEKVLWIPKKCF